MSDSAMTGGDPETVDATAHQTVTNDAVAGEPVYDTDTEGSARARLDAEATEEQYLDERHANTGELYTGGNDFDEIAPETDPVPSDDDNR